MGTIVLSMAFGACLISLVLLIVLPAGAKGALTVATFTALAAVLGAISATLAQRDGVRESR